MNRTNLVWSSEQGDVRKNKNERIEKNPVTGSPEKIILHLRRLTAGKGRTVIEISNLPNNTEWCKEIAKDLKKSLGVSGTYKNNIIEIHTDSIEKISSVLEKKEIKWKKTGG